MPYLLVQHLYSLMAWFKSKSLSVINRRLSSLRKMAVLMANLPISQQAITKFFHPLNEKRPPDHLQQPRLEKVKCHHFWQPEEVKHFKDDRQTRCSTAKCSFLKDGASGRIDYFKTTEGHKSCREYKARNARYPNDAKEVIKSVNKSLS